MLGKTQNTEIGLYFSLLRWLLNAFCSSLGSLSFPNNISFSQIKDHSQGVKATFAIPFFNLVRMKNPKLITIEKKLSIYEILLLLLWTLCFTWTLWGKKKKNSENGCSLYYKISEILILFKTKFTDLGNERFKVCFWPLLIV